MNDSFHADAKSEAIKKLRFEEQTKLKMLRKKFPYNILAILKLKLKYKRLKDECNGNLYLNV